MTRQGSKTQLPAGVKPVPVDYTDETALVAALRGQQFLIITLSVIAPPATHSALVQAAAKAGVPHIMPNIFGLDTANARLMAENPLAGDPAGTVASVAATGVCAWTTMTCSLWYEYSVAMGETWFGFDHATKTLTLYDDGNTRINVTTWVQCGRAVAALLSLPALPADAADTATLTVSRWRNRPLVVSSFLLSQRDMFASWKRVSGDADADWTVVHEPSKARYERGLDMMNNAGPANPWAARMGAATASFARTFYPDGGGDYENTARGLDNAVLGLPQEDLDECTRVAMEMVEEGYAAKLFARAMAG